MECPPPRERPSTSTTARKTSTGWWRHSDRPGRSSSSTESRASLLPRPDLEQQLRASLSARLTTIVAGTGYGKTALLRECIPPEVGAVHTVGAGSASLWPLTRGIVDGLRRCLGNLPPELAALESVRGRETEDAQARAAAIATLVCQVLAQKLERDVVLAVDNVHALEPDFASARLVEQLCRQAPARLHLVLSGREQPRFRVDRLRAEGEVVAITAEQLAFSLDEVTSDVHAATGGWPAAVGLAEEAVRAGDPLPAPATPQPQLFAALAAQHLARRPPALTQLLSRAALLESFEASEVPPDAGAELFVEPVTNRPGWLALSPVARDYALRKLAPRAEEGRQIRLAAAEEHLASGRLGPALGLLRTAGDTPRLARVLTESGSALLRSGRAEAVLDAVDSLPPGLRVTDLEWLRGKALHACGDWDGALAAFNRAAVGHSLPSEIAWRAGLAHYLRGDLGAAAEMYERGALDGTSERDDALLLAWRATLGWARGNRERCRGDARRARELAGEAHDHEALAAAETALALAAALEGDRPANDAHYRRALGYAERAGDVLQIVRIRINRASYYLEQGSYSEALDELEIAIPLAELAGLAPFHALALTNRGEIELRLGRLEEARADLEAARRIYGRLGSMGVAYPLNRLGDLFRIRGESVLARACYEEALSLAEASEDLQGLIPALAGLGRLMQRDDPHYARRAVVRALAQPGMERANALLAAASLAVSTGDRASAEPFVDEALEEAGGRSDRASLAEALELKALCEQDTGRALTLLSQARAAWEEIGDPLGKLRTDLAKARRLGSDGGLELAATSGQRAGRLGAHALSASARALVAELEHEAGPPVSVSSLGTFTLWRRGSVVPAAEWSSDDARHLLELLLAERGGPVAQERIAATLWAGTADAEGRLAAAIAGLRGVLDPDHPDRYVSQSGGLVSLGPERIDVDVERFVELADQALRSAVAEPTALAALERAEEIYDGDFLEGRDERWVMPLRDHARELYVRVATRLADYWLRSGDTAAAARYLLRVLERHPHDERAHLKLISLQVAGGRHAEAHRHYRSYCGRMEEIDAEPAPFPALPH